MASERWALVRSRSGPCRSWQVLASPSRDLKTMKIARGRPLGIWLALVLGLSLVESVAWACPNCRDALASDPNQAHLVRGLFYSIIFLLSMPFLILGGLSSYFYWQVRQARTRAALASATPLRELGPTETAASRRGESPSSIETSTLSHVEV